MLRRLLGLKKTEKAPLPTEELAEVEAPQPAPLVEETHPPKTTVKKAPSKPRTTKKTALTEEAPAPAAKTKKKPTTSWVERLATGLKRSSSQITDSFAGIFTRKRLDHSMLDALEEALITADMGVTVAAELRDHLARERMDKDVEEAEIRELLAGKIATLLTPGAQPLTIPEDIRPFVISVVGVNGNGKTTTAAKLAHQFQQEGKRVMLAAADTFRAAAVEQLQVWGTRLGCTVVVGDAEADPASVAFRALTEAREQKVDVLLIDTAGRLHNKTGLMQELQKIHRVLGKQDNTAPHATLLVLDATTGQNAHQQVRVFHEMVPLSGLIVTKLDGTAKGGVVVGLARAFSIPICAIGVGEQMDDLRPFTASDFARSLMGIEST